MISLSRLEEKFRIHSQPDKAHDVRRLTEAFLSSSLEDNYPRSDAHYGTLSFLLCLSESPLHAHYVPLLTTPTQPPEVEWFDWTAHLLEGIEYSSTESSGSEVGNESSGSEVGNESSGSEVGNESSGSEVGNESSGSEVGNESSGSEVGNESSGSEVGNNALSSKEHT